MKNEVPTHNDVMDALKGETVTKIKHPKIIQKIHVTRRFQTIIDIGHFTIGLLVGILGTAIYNAYQDVKDDFKYGSPLMYNESTMYDKSLMQDPSQAEENVSQWREDLRQQLLLQETE